MGRPYVSITVGDAVEGLLSPTDYPRKTAYLPGRRPVSFSEWRTASHRSFFEDGVVLGRGDIFALPALGCRYLMPHKGRSAQLVFQHHKQRAVAAQAMAPPPAAPKAPPPKAPQSTTKNPKRRGRIPRFDLLLQKYGLLKEPLPAADPLVKLGYSLPYSSFLCSPNSPGPPPHRLAIRLFP